MQVVKEFQGGAPSSYKHKQFQVLLLEEEILHQLIVYPIIYRVLYIPGGAGFLPSTVSLILPTLICR